MSFSAVIVYDVPHLGLAHRVVAAHCQFVVGMDLDGEVVARIDELYQKRETAAEPCVVFFACQGSFLLTDHLGEVLSCICSVGHYGFVARNV